MKAFIPVLIAIICFSACTSPKSKSKEWVSLFNGKDLEGWTVKITGHEPGDNFGNTFRVEDGLLRVRYDAYDEFGNRFGHIFTNKSYSNYKLRVEYRFTDNQVAGGPGWAYRNNGVMFHAQSPESMHREQDFPVSIEAQLLGGDGTGPRTTGNICTPGTEVHINNRLYTAHCFDSNSATYDGDRWVTFELVVYADSIAHHIVEGDTVLTYTRLTVGGEGVNPKPDIAAGPLKGGRIALQAESHPTDFRKIEIMELD